MTLWGSVVKMFKSLIFENKNEKLVGILHIPDELNVGEKVPGIILYHGFTGNKTEDHRLFVHLARALCDSGLVVFRFDFRDSEDREGDFEARARYQMKRVMQSKP